MSTPIPATVPALVTGASSGIGAEFARQLAARGHELVLVARRADRLEALAAELRDRHGVRVTVHPADLEREADREAVAARLRDRSPWLLVNNAGFGSRGRLDRLEADRERAEVMVNVVALHQLTLAVLPGNVSAGAGGVINVASTAAFQPLPHMATYGATKSFVLHFTEAIAEELRSTGARALALCPGPTRTEFGEVAGVAQEFEMILPMGAPAVVRAALRALDAKRAICVPGVPNWLGSQGPRLAPRAAVRRVTGALLSRR